MPSGRWGAIGWTDASGRFWLFGGVGFDASGVTYSWLNDLWSFSPGTRQRTWIGGSSSIAAPGIQGQTGIPDVANVPGARWSASSWTDAAGKLWLFAGWGNSTLVDQDLNSDLWVFDPAANDWAFVGFASSIAPAYGTQGVSATPNSPGGRQNAMTWVDAAGHRRLFGGQGMSVDVRWVIYNDLWRF